MTKVTPEVELSLEELNGIGPGGNAYSILGKVVKALKKAGYSDKEVEEYRKEATSGDFKNLIKVTEKWVDVI